jgi:hypothetical protein
MERGAPRGAAPTRTVSFRTQPVNLVGEGADAMGKIDGKIDGVSP